MLQVNMRVAMQENGRPVGSTAQLIHMRSQEDAVAWEYEDKDPGIHFCSHLDRASLPDAATHEDPAGQPGMLWVAAQKRHRVCKVTNQQDDFSTGHETASGGYKELYEPFKNPAD